MFESKLGNAAAKVRAALADKTAEQIAGMDAALSVDFSEHFSYQTAQSHAFAGGRIAQADATYIYAALGEGYGSDNGGWAVGADVATKYVVTLAVGELLKANIADRARV